MKTLVTFALAGVLVAFATSGASAEDKKTSKLDGPKAAVGNITRPSRPRGNSGQATPPTAGPGGGVWGAPPLCPRAPRGRAIIKVMEGGGAAPGELTPAVNGPPVG